MSEWSDDIKKAPFQKVVWVKNDVMQNPVMATRGYSDEFGVHPDSTFFTSVFTQIDKFSIMPSGRLVCPNKWRHVEKATTP